MREILQRIFNDFHSFMLQSTVYFYSFSYSPQGFVDQQLEIVNKI